MSTWITATVLQVLAAQQLARGSVFTATELDAWLAGRITPEQRVYATSRLVRLQMLQHQPIINEQHQRADQYTVTADGAEAIAAAASGHTRKSGPKGQRAPNPLHPESLVMRLWQLVRMRRIVDTDSATATLCNAGEGNYASTEDSVRKYLRRWADAGALEEARRRVGAQGKSNGRKRYVLREEWQRSPEPPRWRQIKRSQEGQA